MPARWTGRQLHNQPERSHQHGFLVELWDGVRADTGGALDITVHAGNGGVAGSDPEVLRMVVAGEVEFHTLMGGILGRLVPAMEVQGLPFAFPDAEAVFAALDGPLGEHLGAACEAAGLWLMPRATFENGFRHITSATRPVRHAGDLAGMRMRVPDGEVFRDMFAALGAVPVTINIAELYDGLRDGRAEAAENALVVNEFNRLYEVQRYLCLSGHMWSGFNLIGNGGFWRGLPAEIRDAAMRRAAAAASRQRAWTAALNRELEDGLVRRGMERVATDVESFRPLLAADGFGGHWRERVGRDTWALLEAATAPRG